MVNGTQLPVVFGINCSSAPVRHPRRPELRRAAGDEARAAALSPASATPASARRGPTTTWRSGSSTRSFPQRPAGRSARRRRPSASATSCSSGKIYMAAKNDGGQGDYTGALPLPPARRPSAQMWVNDPKEIDVDEDPRRAASRSPCPTPAAPSSRCSWTWATRAGHEHRRHALQRRRADRPRRGRRAAPRDHARVRGAPGRPQRRVRAGRRPAGRKAVETALACRPCAVPTAERLQAWFVTGPLGHLWSALGRHGDPLGALPGPPRARARLAWPRRSAGERSRRRRS